MFRDYLSRPGGEMLPVPADGRVGGKEPGYEGLKILYPPGAPCAVLLRDYSHMVLVTQEGWVAEKIGENKENTQEYQVSVEKS